MPASQRPHVTGSVSTVQTLTNIGFSAAEIAGAIRAWVTPHDGDLVYLLNGEVPTTTDGHIFKTETTYEITEQVGNLQIVAQSSAVNTTVELETYG
jgi:hypothetical protein